MNRVSTYNDDHELVFDLCGNDVDFSDMRICALKTALSSCRVETFCISNDSDSEDCMDNDMSSSLKDICYLYSDDTGWVAVDNVSDGVTFAWLDGYEMVQASPICLRDDRTWRPKRFPVTCHSPFDASAVHGEVDQSMGVCTVSLEDQNVEILIDSGSDATVIPLSFATCGRSLEGSSNLIECQGKALDTTERREFSFVMHSMCGKTIRFRETGHVSSSVTCPIISYGRLFKRGWRIGGSNQMPVLQHETSGIAISMAFKNKSFILQGCIRRLQQVNAIRVQVPQRLQQLSKGWYFTEVDLPMCRSAGECFIDPSEHFSIDVYPFRTTIALRSEGWEVVESCKRLMHVADKRPILELKVL